METGRTLPFLASRARMSAGGVQVGHSVLRVTFSEPVQMKPSRPTLTAYFMARPEPSTW